MGWGVVDGTVATPRGPASPASRPPHQGADEARYVRVHATRTRSAANSSSDPGALIALAVVSPAFGMTVREDPGLELAFDGPAQMSRRAQRAGQRDRAAEGIAFVTGRFPQGICDLEGHPGCVAPHVRGTAVRMRHRRHVALRCVRVRGRGAGRGSQGGAVSAAVVGLPYGSAVEAGDLDGQAHSVVVDVAAASVGSVDGDEP